MSNDKSDTFDLPKKSETQNKPDAQQTQIEELRALARSLRDANNALVSQLWDVDMQLTQLKDDAEEEKEMLSEKKQELENQIKDAGYQEKYQTLLKQIQALEISIYGHSDIGNSPFVL